MKKVLFNARTVGGSSKYNCKPNHKFDSAALQELQLSHLTWTDGWENHMLTLDKYDSGPDAPYESWVLLEKAAPVREEGVP